jgi:multisubunit Na+/H+ antiporter MnhC subunit
MPFIEILVLTGIVTAFAVFGLVLAWGDYQTRHLPRMRAEAERHAQDAPDDVKLAA